MNNQQIQEVIDDLYTSIDKANRVFDDSRCDFTVCRVLHISFRDSVDSSKEYVSRESGASPDMVSTQVPWSGDCCATCGGQMIRTGTCETCTSCGEMSGGCS